MTAFNIIAEIFITPIGWNIAIGCFIAGATCMAVNYHRRLMDMQRQNDQLADLLQEIKTAIQITNVSSGA